MCSVVRTGDTDLREAHTLVFRLICFTIVFRRANWRYRSSRSASSRTTSASKFSSCYSRTLAPRMTRYMFKKTKKAKILEDFLSDTRAKNVEVQREGERSAILLLCVLFPMYLVKSLRVHFSEFVSCEVAPSQDRRWQQNFAIILKI
jgi:hypothetical protein